MQFPGSPKKRLSTDGSTYSSRQGAANAIPVLVLIGLGLMACSWFVSKPAAKPTKTQSLTKSSGNNPAGTNPSNKKRYPVTIRKPAGPPRVLTGEIDIHGDPITVACSTCHSTREPNPENKLVSDLNEFHGSMNIAHGTISCLSCHNSTDYDALKLADGSRIEFTDVMTLCAQCHGPQMRDYEHGAHGGFNGHWDLTRGPQEKNNCIDCHNPHAPKFPKMQPTFKPRDRFLGKENHERHE